MPIPPEALEREDRAQLNGLIRLRGAAWVLRSLIASLTPEQRARVAMWFVNPAADPEQQPMNNVTDCIEAAIDALEKPDNA